MDLSALKEGLTGTAAITVGEEHTAPRVGSGKVRVLATLTTARTADLPEVPTFTELGYPQMQASGAVAMFGPAGMSPVLTDRISKAVQAAIADPVLKEKVLKMGMEAQSSTPQELDAFDRSELQRWGTVVKASGYVPE